MKTIKTYKKTLLCALVLGFASLSAFAQNGMVMKTWSGGAVVNEQPTASVDSVTFAPLTIEVTVDKTAVELEVGGQPVTVVATVLPAYVVNKTVTWKSDNTAIATVADGVITAVAPGTTTITVASVADPTKTATVSVEVLPAKVLVSHQIISGLNIESANDLTATDMGDFIALVCTGNDANLYTTALPENVGLPAYSQVLFKMEYQINKRVGNSQLFYADPDARGGMMTPETLLFETYGMDATDESKWATFTFDCAPAIALGWGNIGHRFRWDIVNFSPGTTVYVRKVWFELTVTP
jgi:hypothetical protein